MNVALNPETGRLPVNIVEYLQRLTGGDAKREAEVLAYILAKFGAPNLLYLPAAAAGDIIRNPSGFLERVREHHEPFLNF